MPCIMAQKSVSSGISRKSATSDTHRTTARGGVNTAAGSATEVKTTDPAWMNIVYRSLDLNDPANAVLYYPEEAADGQDNLFRLMLRLIAGNNITAYEYLDGRENFSETNRLNVKDMLDRFQIMHTDAKDRPNDALSTRSPMWTCLRPKYSATSSSKAMNSTVATRACAVA